jgi:hypothetical protein
VEVIFIIHVAHNPYSMEWSLEVNLRLCPNTRALETSILYTQSLYQRNKSTCTCIFVIIIILKHSNIVASSPGPPSFSMLHTIKWECLGDRSCEKHHSRIIFNECGLDKPLECCQLHVSLKLHALT